MLLLVGKPAGVARNKFRRGIVPSTEGQREVQFMNQHLCHKRKLVPYKKLGQCWFYVGTSSKLIIYALLH